MRRFAAIAALVALGACSAKEETQDYIRKSHQIEARVTLTSLASKAQDYVLHNGALPTGTIGPTPAQPCCTYPEKTCPPNPAEWRHPLWEQLRMRASPRLKRFQYAYQSDGTSFTATATGDVLCEGRPVTFTITGKLGADKQLVVDESQLESAK